MVRAGEDVTFIDPWPEDAEQMRRHGLRVTQAKEVPEFIVPARALHVTDAQCLAKEKPIDIAFICMKSYDPAWATMLIRQYLAADGYVVSLQNCMNEKTIAGIVDAKRLGALPARSPSTSPSPAISTAARKGRGSAHRVPRRRGAWADHCSGRGSLPPGWHRRQRQGHGKSLGRAMVEVRGERDGERALGLHRPHQQYDS
jgi:2-dehydropantoate 2-reductase